MIRSYAHVAQEGPVNFFDKTEAHINEMQKDGLNVEIQYQTTMQLSGVALFSAVIIGRESNSFGE